MYQALIYFFIGISLSMDAFILSLSTGINNVDRSNKIILPLLTGSFHFLMPLIGNKIGSLFYQAFFEYSNYVSAFLLLIVLVEMIIPKRENNPLILNIITSFIFALTVSLDSLTVGIAFGINRSFSIVAPLIFSITSASFTYIGLLVGEKLGVTHQKTAKLLGIILMLIVIIKCLLKT